MVIVVEATATMLHPPQATAHIDFCQQSDVSSSWLSVGGWVVSAEDDFNYLAVYSSHSPRAPVAIAKLHGRGDVNIAVGVFSRNVGFHFNIDVRFLPVGSLLYLVPLIDRWRRGHQPAETTLYDRRKDAIAVITIHANDQQFQSLEAGVSPLFITSLGRSGSTVACGYLGTGERIFNYDRYPSEARLIAYWMHLMQMVGAPADPGLGALSQQFADVPFFAAPNPFASATDYPELARIIAADRARVEEDIAATASRQIEALSMECRADATKPRYFVEKCVPGTLLPRMAGKVFPGTREIILVRNPLDWCRSVKGFFADRGRETVQAFSTSDALMDVATRSIRDLRMLADYIEQRRGSALVVHYEKLVEKDPVTFAAISAYLGCTAFDLAELDHEVAPEHRSTVGIGTDDDADVAALLEPFARVLGYPLT